MQGQGATEPALEPVDILIVDDKPANIVSLEAVLRRADYNLVSVTNGQDGLKHVLGRDFAVILLDVMMPEMDGFEFARLLKKRSRVNPTPIIFLTAIATEFRYLVEGYQVGAVDYLQKPLDPEIVKAKVAVFVDLFRKNQRIKRQEAELREIQRLEQERRLLEVERAGQRHYDELAESIPQIVWSADPDGQVKYLNSKWTDLTGIPAADAVADAELRRSCYHPDDRTHLEAAAAFSYTNGVPLEFEFRMRDKKTGQWRWHLCRAVPERAPAATGSLSGAGGRIVGWHGTFTDIHQQKRMEAAQRFLAEANMLFTSATDYRDALSALAARFVPDFADGCVVDLAIQDKPFRRYVAARGLPPGAEQRLAGATTREAAAETLGLALGSGRPTLVTSDLRHIGAASDLGLTALLSAPIDIRGGDAGAISLFTVGENQLDQADLDLAVEACRHLAIAIDHALVREDNENNVRRKDEFLAILSHELRTPLNAVIGWSELLKMEEHADETLKGLDAIERNAKSLAQLVGDLLDVSRIITGKMEVVRKPLDLAAFLRGLCESFRPLADEKGLTLIGTFPARTVLVSADQGRLHQVFANLLTNAIKFTPPGGTVRLDADVEGERSIVRVRDSGIGIERSMLPIVFERFRQADSSRTRRHGGLGLGLSIVKHIVEQHDGDVSAFSDGEGKGTVFTVRLPLFSKPEERPLIRGGEARAKTPANLAGVTVLLVDDDASSRTLTSTFLKFGGATVRAAGSVSEAVSMIEAAAPDVVLTDIGMPDADGFELLARLEVLAARTGQRTPVAALSAYASAEDAQRALAAGFDRYLSKPVPVGELIQAVAAMTGRAPASLSSDPASATERLPANATQPVVAADLPT